MVSNWVIIKKGEPYIAGEIIKITNTGLKIGRSSEQNIFLNIKFASRFISRTHCRISCDGGKVLLTDMGSKHGSLINNDKILPDIPRELHNNDRISLASGIVIMQFCQGELSEETVDFSDTQAERVKSVAGSILLNKNKRECTVEGCRVVLTRKEWDCLYILYNRANEMVLYEELAAGVWTERTELPGNVGQEEFNALIYRLRKKLGEKGRLIKNIRGLGVMLEL
ncbi:MAG: transcriptional regulator, winged helix family [Firmicutes bacterium]|nr:transcriptional regulator, winged helix family [Bacillota bacterium]